MLGKQINQDVPIIIKLGGSVITKKNKAFEVDQETLGNLIEDLALYSSPFILIHGAGSFGHILAKEYSLVYGMKDEKQKHGFSHIRASIDQLRLAVIDTMLDKGLMPFPIQTSMFLTTANQFIFSSNYEPLLLALQHGFIPVLHGDIVFDHKQGASIVSGDKIISYLTQLLPPTKVFFVTDVDGIYSDDPKFNENAQLYEKLTLRDLYKIESEISASTEFTDVTGSMKGKFTEIKNIVQNGNEVIILNGYKDGNLYKALQGDYNGMTFIKH